jgi:hypothetical protein
VLRFDLFCRVIDNYGDAGVCWRLARRLVSIGHPVRLFIDDMARLEPLLPAESQEGAWPGIEVLDFNTPTAACGDVVIEAFACDLPPAHVQTMVERLAAGHAVVWFNLEYLSAEAWVESHHGLPSPQATSRLNKTFFFPGFTARTGGLLHGDCALPVRVSWLPRSEKRQLFAFGYADMQWDAIFNGLAAPAHAWQIATQITEIVEAAARAGIAATLQPWVDQEQFDRCLAEHDMVIVRGEDSFVRAQLLGIPLLWQIYRQSEDYHLVKLDAWLDLYLAGLDSETAGLIRAAHALVNARKQTAETGKTLWKPLMQRLPQWQMHASAWAQRLRKGPELALQLVEYSAGKL